ncbi:dihydroneopterin aldolase [Synergistaceae bacterium OttesenSCG-928-I11]|nr:dihydroneopterin aldolase [Synergistaceae bacterium OttesenSCG-928-I11]
MLGKYTIRGMHFHAFHGSLEVERELGLVFIVDVTLFFPLSPEDASQSAVSKIKGADVYETAKGVMMGTKFKSRVSLALRIAREMLARFEKASEVHVKITRKHFFIPGDVEAIEAEVQCTREDFPVDA